MKYHDIRTENAMAEALFVALLDAEDDLGDTLADSIATFRDVGLMTHDEGLVVTLANGAEFQLTVKLSQPARAASRSEFTECSECGDPIEGYAEDGICEECLGDDVGFVEVAR